MKILFIKTSIGTSDTSYFDMGIALMSAELKKNGHETSYFSLDGWESLNTLNKRLTDFRPEVVGFTAVNSTFKSVTKISKFVKDFDKNIFCLCGGVHVTLCPEDFIKVNSLDAICLGEGEYALRDLVNELQKKDKDYLKVDGFWFREGNNIIKTKKRPLIDINNLELPDRSIFATEGSLYLPGEVDKNVRNIEFILSRGCPFKCTYCSNHALNDYYGTGYVRFKDPAKAVEEILDATKKYRVDSLVFHDDLFTLKKDWLEKFLDLYKNKVNLPFVCNIRVGTCDLEVLRKLKQSGCAAVKVGLESGDEKLRESILGRTMSNAKIVETFKNAKKVGLSTAAFIMVGLPEETPQAFRRTIELVAEINPDYKIFYVFYPYKGTKLYDLCKENGYIVSKQNSDFVERTDTVLKQPSFSREDIMYYFRNFYLLVYYRAKSSSKSVEGWRNKALYFLKIDSPSSPFFKFKQFLYRLILTITSTYRGLFYVIGLRESVE